MSKNKTFRQLFRYFVDLALGKLKDYRNILIAFTLVFICNLGFSSTINGQQLSSGQEQEQEGNRKSSQTMMNPDGDVGTSEQQVYQEETSIEKESEVPDSLEGKELMRKDSVEDASVSKYNFIFYLLYKFKYDTAP